MISIANITAELEQWAPLSYQESYDNAGLLVGHPATQVSGVLLTLDVLPEIIDEAEAQNCNLIIAHHPIIFRGLKRLNGANYVERTIIKAIKSDIAIYAIHTNLDNILTGVNAMLSRRLGLENCQILKPKSEQFLKLTTMVPADYTEQVAAALAAAGAGHIGDYSHCGFRVEGTGTFKPKPEAQPFIGKHGQLEKVAEVSLTYILPKHLKNKVLSALKASHPYEEVAYFLAYLANEDPRVGSGMIGTLPQALSKTEFLKYLKKSLNLECFKYTKKHEQDIQKVAVCGGVGSFLLATALKHKADAFVTSDFKYHEFFDAEDRITVADIGHYESEVSTKSLLKEFLEPKFKNLRLMESKINTNPVGYF